MMTMTNEMLNIQEGRIRCEAMMCYLASFFLSMLYQSLLMTDRSMARFCASDWTAAAAAAAVIVRRSLSKHVSASRLQLSVTEIILGVYQPAMLTQPGHPYVLPVMGTADILTWSLNSLAQSKPGIRYTMDL